MTFFKNCVYSSSMVSPIYWLLDSLTKNHLGKLRAPFNQIARIIGMRYQGAYHELENGFERMQIKLGET